MKCVKTNGGIKRVSDELAAEMVRKKEASYCSKQAWKSARKAAANV